MDEIEIGAGKTGRRAFGLDEVAVVPSRRTRDTAEVDISWQLEAYSLGLPLMAAPADSVVSPATAASIAGLGGLPVLDLEGVWTRHEEPEEVLARIASAPPDRAREALRSAYSPPVRPDLVTARIGELGAAGVVACASVTPQGAAELAPVAVAGGLDVLVIRGNVVSAEHVVRSGAALNLKHFIREMDVPVVIGCSASYQTCLHLMRTGAVGVLVGAAAPAPGGRDVLGVGVPLATSIADAAGARTRHLEETGAYVQVIADGPLLRGGDISRAIACGADAVMLGAALAASSGAPGKGAHFDSQAVHRSLPLGGRSDAPARGSLEEILLGPANDNDGFLNLFGALRASMATCGYVSVREFHKAEMVVCSQP